MKNVRMVAAVLVGVLLATGLVRGSNGQFGALKNRAKKMLESTANKNDVAVEDDAICVKGVTALALITPGSEQAFTLNGTFPENTSFSVVGAGLSITGPTVAKTSFAATLAASPDALPGAAVVRGSTKRGRSADAVVGYVGGAWRIEGTTDNGWRTKFSPVQSSTRSALAFKGEIFEGKAAAPFATRDASIALGPQSGTPASYVLEFKAPDFSMDDDECGPVMKKANQLADQLMKAKTKAEEDRIGGEIDKIQDAVDTCMEKQQNSAAKIQSKMKAIQKSAEFTCSRLELSVAADGAAEGTLDCGGVPHAFTGTMKLAK